MKNFWLERQRKRQIASLLETIQYVKKKIFSGIRGAIKWPTKNAIKTQP